MDFAGVVVKEPLLCAIQEDGFDTLREEVGDGGGGGCVVEHIPEAIGCSGSLLIIVECWIGKGRDSRVLGSYLRVCPLTTMSRWVVLGLSLNTVYFIREPWLSGNTLAW